jgi:hypothetical protein
MSKARLIITAVVVEGCSQREVARAYGVNQAGSAAWSPATASRARPRSSPAIGIGRTHARTPVLLLVQDLHVRVVNAATGELLRELVIDPTRNYQPIHPSHTNTTSPRTHAKGSR